MITGASAAKRTSRFPRLSLTTNLLGTMTPQDVHRVVDAVSVCFDPHTEVTATEAWIIADRRRESRNPREAEHGEHRRESTDEHHDLEAENRIGHPARDRLAADDERPVVGHPHWDPIAERHTGQTKDEREYAHLAGQVPHHVIELVAGG